MTPETFLTAALTGDWRVLVPAAAGLLGALFVAAWLLRRKGRGKLARRVTSAATLLGLGWSAQGMWDTAVHHYHQDIVVAWVLFVVFEAMLAARMLKAHEYRADRGRRARHVQSVWVIASVMAAVVALGEGPAQAPARLAIPLLVAYGWYVDLIADDDPGEHRRTSWRWTPRELGLAIGALKRGSKDVETIDQDALRDQLVKLAFREHHGAELANDLLRRKVRLQRLQTLATEADLAEARARLARSRVALMAEDAQTPPSLPASIPARRLPAGRRVNGVHTRAGRTMRGPELQADAVAQLLASVSPAAPRGMATVTLAHLYDPPLKSRTADEFASAARRQIPRPVNGFSILPGN